jgi:hypothetical protein
LSSAAANNPMLTVLQTPLTLPYAPQGDCSNDLLEGFFHQPVDSEVCELFRVPIVKLQILDPAKVFCVV